MSTRDGIGLLREKLAPGEVTIARRIADDGGAPALLARALERYDASAHAGQRILELSAALEREPHRAQAIVAAHLRETVLDPRALRGDLKELARGRANRLNLSALGERAST